MRSSSACGCCCSQAPRPRAMPVQRHHVGIVQVAQALHVEHHDLAQPRQLRPDFQRLVELLFVLDEQHHGAGVFAQVLDLARCVGRVDAIGHTGAAHDGQVGQDPFDQGVGQDGRTFTTLKPQAQEPAADLAHRLGGLVPGPAVPDAEVFLAQPDLGAARCDCVPEQLGHGFARHLQRGVGLVMRQRPEVAHDVISTSSSSSSAGPRAHRSLSCRGRTP